MKKKFKSILSLVILLSAAVVTPAFQVVAESQVFSESPQVDQEEVKTVQSDDTNASADAGQATSQVVTVKKPSADQKIKKNLLQAL
ncbi:hypothetical protein ACMHYI_15180 [Candidatus Enterenecus avicola]